MRLARMSHVMIQLRKQSVPLEVKRGLWVPYSRRKNPLMFKRRVAPITKLVALATYTISIEFIAN